MVSRGRVQSRTTARAGAGLREIRRAGRAAAVARAARTARAARLHYVTERPPGISRRRAGKGWVFLDPAKKRITDPETLQRIRKLAIPPAYRDVWISSDPTSHLQAVGRDARGRWQYRYHADWRAVRDDEKYRKVLVFGRVLPKLRERVKADLARPGLPREKVLAAIVRLMEKTLVRVGNEEYARTNNSFGLTTLRNRHVRTEGGRIRMHFRAKHGIERDIELSNRQLARIVQQCRELPGQLLFQYLDSDGKPHAIGSGDVNNYLREVTGEDITAKDFRTWAGTYLAALALAELGRFSSQRAAKSALRQAAEKVARELGNTASICRKCYIHPEIFEAYLDGDLIEHLKDVMDDQLSEPTPGLSAEEAAIMAFLHRRLSRAAARPAQTASTEAVKI